jgi:amidase
MARHTFEPTSFHLTIGEHEPGLRVADGDSIATWTIDATGRDAREEKLSDGGNPQTGPFFVEGAEPGDTLGVRFDRLWPNRTRGLTGEVVAETVVDPWFVRELPERSEEDADYWEIDLERGTARLESSVAGLEFLGEVPIEPMLGCFGVAPGRGQAISCATSGRHGGNMDYRGFRQGVTVFLPVLVEGALLHVGDGHALQGDGEVSGTAIETPVTATLTFDVRDDLSLEWPIARIAGAWLSFGFHEHLGRAARIAVDGMLDLMERELGVARGDALALASVVVDLRVTQVVNEALGVHAVLRDDALG